MIGGAAQADLAVLVGIPKEGQLLTGLCLI